MKIADQSMIHAVNEAARDYAHDRAAEMVGKKWVDGVLVDNPDAQWAITETTRDVAAGIIEDASTVKTPMNEIQDAIRSSVRVRRGPAS